MKNKENQASRTTANTIELLHRILRSLRCEPVDVDEETLQTEYQGEQFLFFVNQDYVRINDLAWNTVNINDPSLLLFYTAINLTNTNCSPTVFLSKPDENGHMYINSRWDVKLHPECPDNVTFIKEILSAMLDAKQYLRKCTYDLFLFKIEKERKRGSAEEAPLTD